MLRQSLRGQKIDDTVKLIHGCESNDKFATAAPSLLEHHGQTEYIRQLILDPNPITLP